MMGIVSESQKLLELEAPPTLYEALDQIPVEDVKWLAWKAVIHAFSLPANDGFRVMVMNEMSPQHQKMLREVITRTRIGTVV